LRVSLHAAGQALLPLIILLLLVALVAVLSRRTMAVQAAVVQAV
jgi:hypothetical protein